MALLQPSEYDASYFDGELQATRHNAGYSVYRRWYRNESNDFFDVSSDILNRYSVGNKKVLDIGCAKGFLVEDLVGRGIDAYGIDVSPYAIGEANPSIASRLTIADIRTHLSTYKNREFSLLIGMNILCCFSDSEIASLVTQINRISATAFFVCFQNANSQFYNSKTIEEWKDGFNWGQGTVFSNINKEWVVK